MRNRIAVRITAEKKKAEIIDEINKTAIQLGTIREHRDNLDRDIRMLKDEKGLLQASIDQKHQEISLLEDIQARKQREIVVFDSELSLRLQRKSSIELEIKIIEDKLQTINDDFQSKAQKLEEIDTKIVHQRIVLTQVTSEIENFRKEMVNIHEKSQKERDTINQKMVELKEKEKSIGKMIAQNNISLGNIEIYARRLQNYYYESGIKLNILPEFGIK